MSNERIPSSLGEKSGLTASLPPLRRYLEAGTYISWRPDDWSKRMGAVVPFPRTRDRSFVWRQARRMAESKPRAADNWLAHILKKQRESLVGKGVDLALVEDHVRALEVAIRCELHRILAEEGGAA